MINKCPVCKKDISPVEFRNSSITTINCKVCGMFRVSKSSLREILVQKDLSAHYIYSGALRELSEKERDYFLQGVQGLLDAVLVPQNPSQQLDKLLLALERKTKEFGDQIYLNCEVDYPLAYAKGEYDLPTLIRNSKVTGYFELDEMVNIFPILIVTLTLKGIERCYELRKKQLSSNQVFVAMWFDNIMNDVWQNGFIPALKATGYFPLRIDKKEHNNKIDDEIVAEIRKSGLLVADFTENRGGVYFEAGFAMGLGIPVIWTCREDQIANVHFDTRQYSHITWNTPEELKEKLINRIEATIPKPRK